MENIIIFIGLVLATSLCFWGAKALRKKLQLNFNQNGVIPNPNGKGSSLTLYRLNGCGMSFSGAFRQVNINGTLTYVTYYFLHLVFVPILPFGAYRVIDAENGGYHILGSEKMSIKEIGVISLQVLAWLLTIVSIASFIFRVIPEFQ